MKATLPFLIVLLLAPMTAYAAMIDRADREIEGLEYAASALSNLWHIAHDGFQ
jgi:hypothetical protein